MIRPLIRMLPLFAMLSLSASAAPGPFGILDLPTEFDSHRATYRDSVSVAEETVVAEMEGEGCLRHFWLTIGGVRQNPEVGMRLVLRIYVDGSERPSVEVPVAPFFGIHHATGVAEINSPYLQVTGRGGFNSYFPMPFKRGMRITMQSSGRPVRIWFQADWHGYAPGSLSELRRFCAVYRRVNPCEHYGRPYHLAHGEGSGFIAGMTLGIRALDHADHWYHCGGDLLLLDGETARARVLSGIGGEDFFGTAWGQEVYANGSIGTPYYDNIEGASPDDPYLVFAAWRFFDKDPIGFSESFWWNFGSLENDMSSVVYWYQTGEAMPIVKLPVYADRLPDATVPRGKYDLPNEDGRAWLVCGPFECTSREQFEKPEFPEGKFDLDASQPADFGQYRAAARRGWSKPVEAHWQPMGSMFNVLDLTPFNRPRTKTNNSMPTDVSAYALTTVRAERAGKRTLRLGHDDWLRVWINGELVYDGEEQNGLVTHELEVNLKQGDNTVLIKSANFANSNFRAWVFLFDLLDE